MASRGYGGTYKGREPIWKKIVAAVLLLVILASGVVIYLQSHLVYDDQGVARLELPWSREEAPSSSGDPVASVPPDEPLNITVEERDKTPMDIQGTLLDALPLTMEHWEAAEAALPEGLNAVAVTLKDSGGYVYYDSLAAGAIGEKLLRAEEDTSAALRALNEAYPYTIARLSCLLDPVASRTRLEELGLKNTGGYIFYDLYSGTWLDPCKDGARGYIASLARECAALGFDEILLADLSYPTAGKLDKINYGETAADAAGRSRALCAVVTAVRDALAEDYPAVRVSVELPARTVASGADETAGQVLADLAALSDRIYAPAAEAEVPALAEAVARAGDGEGPAFVPETAEPGGLESWLCPPPD